MSAGPPHKSIFRNRIALLPAILPLCGALLGCILACRFLPPYYLAEASVLIEERPESPGMTEAAKGSAALPPRAAGEKQTQQRSYRLLAEHLKHRLLTPTGRRSSRLHDKFPEESPGELRITAAPARPGTVFLAARSRNPRQAENLLQNAVAALREEVEISGGSPFLSVTCKIISLRKLPPDPVRFTLLGALAGLLPALGLQYAAHRFQKRRTLPDVLENGLPIPLLGVLPAAPGKAETNTPAGALYETSLRALRNNVEFLLPQRDGAKVLTFTGLARRDDAGAVAAALAGALEQNGKTVRSMRPADTYFGDGGGLSARPEQDASSLRILERELGDAARHCDYILLDTPPLRGSALPVMLGRLADRAVLVCDCRKLSVAGLKQTVALLHRSGVAPGGLVLTCPPSGKNGSALPDRLYDRRGSYHFAAGSGRTTGL